MNAARPSSARNWSVPALAALVAVAVAAVAVLSLRRLEDSRRSLDRRHAANLAYAGRVILQLEMHAGAARAFLLTQDPSFLEEARRMGGLASRTLDSLQANHPDGDAAAHAARVEKALAEYDRAFRAGLDAGLRETPHRERAAFLVREMLPRKETIDSAASLLLSRMRESHRAARAEGEREAFRGEMLVVATCAAGLFLASILALALGHGLRRTRAQRNHLAARARHAEDLLRSQGALMATISMNTSLGLFLQDREGRLSYMNPAAEKMIGYPLEEAEGKPVHELLHPERPDGSPYSWEECVTGRAFHEGRRTRGEDFFRKKDGTWIPVAVTSSPIHDRGGVAGMVVEAEDITGRKALEARKEEVARALRDAKENLALAAEAAGVGTWETYPDGRVILSGRLLELIGYSGESPAFTLDTVMELVHPEDRERAYQAALRAMDPSRDEPYDQEMRVLLPDGSVRWFKARGRAWFAGTDGVREFECFRGAAMDITDHKAREDALKASDERFNMLARATNDAVYDWDIGSGAIWWNQGIHTLFGFPAEAVRMDIEWWTDRLHPGDRERVSRSLRSAIAAGRETWTEEYRYGCADGTYKAVFDRGFLIRDGGGRPVRLIGAMMDVSARKAAEEELRRFRTLVEESNDFIAMGDLEGRCLFLNAGGRRMAGLEEGRDYGNIVDFLYPEDVEAARRVWRQASSEGQWLGEFRLRHRLTGRPLPVLWNIFPLRRPGNGPFAMAAVGRDMSLLHEQEEQLRQGQKMEAIGKLAGGIAHDFNNILTVVNGYGELLLQKLPSGDPNRSILEVMLDAGRRAAGLTAQLLAYGRKQVLQPRLLDLNDVVEGTAIMLRRIIGENIELRLRLDRTLPKVKADPVQIDQILLNLCINARDAMSGGGSLLVETGLADFREGMHGRFGDLPPGSYVSLTVTDTGSGMAPEVLERIFEPFFTTKETGKGTGLGLSSTYGIVRQSGGGIEVRSDPGRGSAFRVYLPCLARPEPAAEASGAPRAAEGPETGCVLLAEDEAHVRTITRNLLENGGYTVWEARDGAEALEIYERMRPPPDLVLSDVMMPRMGGRQLVEEIRRRRPGQRILFMSGYSEDAVPGTAEGEVRFLQKPFTSKALLEAVHDALHAVVHGA